MLLDHGHRAASAFLVEHQVAAACARQQLCQAIGRGEQGHGEARDAQGDHRPAFANGDLLAAQHRQQRDQRRQYG
ncbi:hypothetical protein D3C80_1698140 [compost metagenome]